ncbi:twin-arginine translocation signal domain-containing protein [Candidatus Acetothermia bacterium]|nr:twin-arginine translocation signal domain-containing protein [Candidatus Acetothermia bacterium]MBI3644212.1 twin-arginine translocation signal domain-containing protein [Candidatus Acetothermia bacterium]
MISRRQMIQGGGLLGMTLLLGGCGILKKIFKPP